MSSRVSVLAFVIVFVGARFVARVAARRDPVTRGSSVIADREDWRERLFLLLYLLGGLVSPLLALGPWLPGLRYALPDWVGWAGLVILLGASVLHVRAIADLGRNYSITMRVRDQQVLVTDGVYAWVRHPVYASLWLIALAQPLLVPHLVFGLSGFLGFALLFSHRLPREEAMMTQIFGDAYRTYRKRVGGVFPKLSRHPTGSSSTPT